MWVGIKHFKKGGIGTKSKKVKGRMKGRKQTEREGERVWTVESRRNQDGEEEKVDTGYEMKLQEKGLEETSGWTLGGTL